MSLVVAARRRAALGFGAAAAVSFVSFPLAWPFLGFGGGDRAALMLRLMMGLTGWVTFSAMAGLLGGMLGGWYVPEDSRRRPWFETLTVPILVAPLAAAVAGVFFGLAGFVGDCLTLSRSAHHLSAAEATSSVSFGVFAATYFFFRYWWPVIGASFFGVSYWLQRRAMRDARGASEAG